MDPGDTPRQEASVTLALVIPGPLDRRSGGYSYDVDLVDHLRQKGHRVEVWSLPQDKEGAEAVLSAQLSSAVDVVVFDALVHPCITDVLAQRGEHSGLWVALVHHLAWLEDPVAGDQSPAKQELERRFLSVMDGWVLNSSDTRQTVKDLLGDLCWRPSVICRPPVAPRGTSPARALAKPFEGHLLFLANVTPRKNLLGLLEALALVRAQHPEGPWHLTVVGSQEFDGPYTALCRQTEKALGLQGRVMWAGRLEQAALEALWSQTDLLTVPSFHEGWGMVYAEAAVRGIPALAVRRGGAVDTLGRAGLWAESAQPEDLAHALSSFFSNAGLRTELGLQARRRGQWLSEGGTGFDELEPFLENLVRWRNPGPLPSSFTFDFDAYLEAKAGVDSRSLHPRVTSAAFSGTPVRSVLELGGGTGTMARRLRSQHLIGPGVNYELVDLRAEGLSQAHDLTAGLFEPGRFVTREADLLAFLEEPRSTPPDLVISHAVLDLFDPETTVGALARLKAQRYWLTHLFDGFTAWDPVVDPDLDKQIIDAYHQTMDSRFLSGGEGTSQSGRRWMTALTQAGFTILDVASSDWVVRPQAGHYPAGEEVFLRSLLHFFRTSLQGHPAVDPAGLSWWLATRESQVGRGQAFFMAHQLDLVAEGPK